MEHSAPQFRLVESEGEAFDPPAVSRMGAGFDELQSEAKYRGLLEAAPDAMVVVNESGEIVLVNLQTEKQFGYSRDELIGQRVTELIPTGFAERLIADGTRTSAEALAQRIGTGIELSAKRKDGSRFPIEIMLSPLASADGVLVTAAIRDISRRKALERTARKQALKIIHSAEHDALTGLPNRVLLNDRIGLATALAARHGAKAAILFLDLDGFKHINDSLGHPVGDKLLQSIARRLETCVRGVDTVSRQGGDEFVVLLSEIDKPDDAAIIARRMLDAVADAHSIEDRDLHITTSIGVSIYPEDGANAEALIKHADTAMYQAKETGRETYRFFTPEMNERAVARQSIEEDLRRAVQHDELALHYQPKIDVETGRITGSEALIRWRHPTRGLVSPAEFIPVAEDSGLIRPIGDWVLHEACRQAAVWLEADLPLGTIAVNVSAVQFADEGFVDRLFEVLQETGLDPKLLQLEITEGVLMRRVQSTAAKLQTLRESGVQIALDDFGTGYSSLSYLRKFPVDVLKIDQSFVSQIGVMKDDTALITAIIDMARALQLRVVAEGVETEAQLGFLASQKCDEAQGYLISRPVAANLFAGLLAEGKSLPDRVES
jgi:diguanylate cyclase (GGDEF)-like protein/PAS domain S-box-containing protein